MQDIDLAYERYKDFDFSGATHTKNPAILEMRARKKAYDAFMSLFDDDVRQILVEQQNKSPQERTRLNAVIRAFYATAH